MKSIRSLRYPLFLAAALCCLAGPRLSQAMEPWVDNRLAVTNGLTLWLDVSRQNAARGAAGMAPLQSWNDAPDLLFDGSGTGHHLSQPILEARPKFRQEFNGAMLSLDGKDDFLISGQSFGHASNITVFIIASPRTTGIFRGPLAFNALGRNDYTSGLNIDFGSGGESALARINVEGAGFSGEANLLKTPQPLGKWHLMTLEVGSGNGGVKLYLDGQAQGARNRAENATLQLDTLTLGARCYSNTPDRPHVQGFYQGDLAEVLVFNRVLPEAERTAVEHYLDSKYGALLHGLPGAAPLEGAVPLIPVTNPPPIKVFLPGFKAQKLPVELSNVNNVRYRPDGKLVAVGYDGRIWLLSDTDGDGLEDKAEPFWDKQTLRAPIGAALTPPGYARGQGVFVAAKDKLALILDTNGDDRADQEITVATWTERSEQLGVDALGVAVGPDGSVYFSLGAASFTEPYLIDKSTGQARYRTSMERGTIQRVSPDFSKRETVCTGIRFAVGMAFNNQGDLFCTDQEGATWLHNGNPLDELLHIQTGRHYGFPPRHPRYLPSVIDEPSVFDYAPQHQSTCGLQFNDPINGGGTFGPSWWAGNALVSGYSRGKLWRTKLVKTVDGYVAQTQLIATVQALTIDACVSPRSDLIVATHSGLPDWGSGPNGKGQLWRIRYQDRDAAQPVAVWNASPTELRVAFDRPLDPSALQDLKTKTRLESGKYVFPGDRYETIRPGYQVVYDQLSAPRYLHEVLSTQLSTDRRTLSVLTRPRPSAVNYAVTLPVRKEGADEEIDLLSDLCGIEATYRSADGKESWSGWLPHLDLAVARELTRGSAEHDRLFQLLGQAGSLTLRGQWNLSRMLYPATQPGAKIDFDVPPEEITVTLESSAAMTASLDSQPPVSASNQAGRNKLKLGIKAPGELWKPFSIQVATGPGLVLGVSWATAEDPRLRAFPLRRFLLPWAKPSDGSASPSESKREIPEIAGGNWLAGRRLFFGDKLACSKCHTMQGAGGHIGPDLSNLNFRDYASVRKDIQFPNATLNPDHIASTIQLNDGESLTGIIRKEENGVLQVAVAGGAVEPVQRKNVRSVKPSQLSLMPEGLWDGMTPDEQRDLMTFLLIHPLEPHPLPMEIQGQKMPPARKRSDVDALLQATAGTAPDGSRNNPSSHTPFHLVLCASAKDAGHGSPGFHDYPLWRERWATLFSLADGVAVETADRWPSAKQWQSADAIVFYHDNPAWDAAKAADLDAFLERGGGLVFLHWSMNGYRDNAALTQRLGKSWGPGSRFRYGSEPLQFYPHALTAGLKTAEFVDEAYWKLAGDLSGATILASSTEEGEQQPQIWVRTQGKGRILVCIPGHFTWTFDDPFYRVLLLRGIAWAGNESLNRFIELATVGARIADD